MRNFRRWDVSRFAVGAAPLFTLPRRGMGVIGGETPYTKIGWWVGIDFRLRASFFLRAQKETKDALKDPWSLRIPFHQDLWLACLWIRRFVSRRGSNPPAAARGQVKGRLPPTVRRLTWVGTWGVGAVPGRFQFCCRGWRPRRPYPPLKRGLFPPYGGGSDPRHAPANPQRVGRGLAPAVLSRQTSENKSTAQRPYGHVAKGGFAWRQTTQQTISCPSGRRETHS